DAAAARGARAAPGSFGAALLLATAGLLDSGFFGAGDAGVSVAGVIGVGADAAPSLAAGFSATTSCSGVADFSGAGADGAGALATGGADGATAVDIAGISGLLSTAVFGAG